jgi:hypothetical protein
MLFVASVKINSTIGVPLIFLLGIDEMVFDRQ